MLPFSSSRAESYLAGGPCVMGQDSKFKSPVFKGKLTKPLSDTCTVKSRVTAIDMVSQQRYEPMSHLRCVKKDYLLLGCRGCKRG